MDRPSRGIRIVRSLRSVAAAAAKTIRRHQRIKRPTDVQTAVAISAVEEAAKSSAAAIIVLTTTGKSAHLISQFKPRCPIIAVTRFAQVARQARLFRGILPIFFKEPALPDWLADVDVRIQEAMRFGKTRRFLKTGDRVVVVTVWKRGAGSTNTTRMLEVD